MKSYGMGIGYSTRTNDGMMRPDAGKPNPRADSFSLYTGWVANRILMNVIPKNLLEQKCQKSMRNNRKKAIEAAEKKDMSASKSLTPARKTNKDSPSKRPKSREKKRPESMDMTGLNLRQMETTATSSPSKTTT